MKILYPLQRKGFGGNVYFNNLIKALSKYANTEIVKVTLPSLRGYIPPSFKFLIKKEKRNCDIVHTNENIGFSVKLKSKPLVVTAHHSVFDPIFQKYTTKLQKIYHYLFLHRYMKKSFKRADVVIAVSNNTKNEIIKEFKIDNIVRIYNGIDTDFFKPLKLINSNKEKRIKLLFVGSLIKRKGVDLLPKIMEKLGDNFILYHTGTKRFENPNIIPIGKLDNKSLIEWYNSCDIFLFPTRLEGFGLCVAEAMACEKPIITTNCSSLPELVVDGKGGFLCEKDNINDFTEKILSLSQDENLRREMGKFNRERIINNFSIEQMAREHYDLYSNLGEK